MLVLPPTSMKLFEEIHIKVIDQERKKKRYEVVRWNTSGFSRECSKYFMYYYYYFVEVNKKYYNSFRIITKL